MAQSIRQQMRLSGKPPRSAATGQPLKHRDHAIGIEAAIGKVDVGVYAKLQLSALLRGYRVDTGVSQALGMFLTLIRVNYMDCLVPTMETVFYEWEQDRIFIVVAVEESADMTSLVEQRAGKGNGSSTFLHDVSPHRIANGPRVKLRMHHSVPKCPIDTLVSIDTFV